MILKIYQCLNDPKPLDDNFKQNTIVDINDPDSFYFYNVELKPWENHDTRDKKQVNICKKSCVCRKEGDRYIGGSKCWNSQVTDGDNWQDESNLDQGKCWLFPKTEDDLDQ